ncbi:MAG: hypothetical protein HGGPFJEG_03124 [Ignavibacteria bacterium]|nr:hypothetical protein [Ignavibacteria bacterium]
MNRKSFILYFICAISFSGEAVFSQMNWNKAIHIGATQYVAVRPTSVINIMGSFTFECWIKRSHYSGSFPLMDKGNHGRIMIYFNGSKFCTRINGEDRAFSTADPITEIDSWIHLAFTYNSSTNVFNFFINGVLDNSVFSSGSTPTSTLNDSLYICKSGAPFPSVFGLIDEVRLWNRALTAAEIVLNMNKSLAVTTGEYNGLVLALNFQSYYETGLSLQDWTGNNNTAFLTGLVSTIDYTNQPSDYLNLNLSAAFDGSNDYIAVEDNSPISPTGSYTLQAWIYPVSGQDALILHKGTPNGSVTDYNLEIVDRKLAAGNNVTDDTIQLNRWTHVALAHFVNGITGTNTFYINGVRVHSFITGSAVPDGDDSLYIGGSIGQSDFEGYIDEVRISNKAMKQYEIQSSLFTSINLDNDSAGDVSYNMDGYSYCNTANGNKLNFRNNVLFSSAIIPPTDRFFNDFFQNSFYIKQSNKRIPESGSSGIMEDTLEIALDENLNQIDLFIALIHGDESNLTISLISPEGNTALVYDHHSTLASGIVTIFSGYADSVINNNYISFCPTIKPVNSLVNQLYESNIKGKWRLVISDDVSGSSGRLYGWGLRFNTMYFKKKLVALNYTPEGFYNPGTNLSISDTVRCFLRNSTSPYNVVDSTKKKYYDNTEYTLTFNSPNVSLDSKYYLQVKHRNSIEIWSSAFISFDGFTSQCFYDFTSEISQTYGDNVKQVDSSPIRFAAFSGDVNQDGVVDATDNGMIDNDASNFVTGYVITDITGDDVTDASDAAIADNNAANFVAAITP